LKKDGRGKTEWRKKGKRGILIRSHSYTVVSKVGAWAPQTFSARGPARWQKTGLRSWKVTRPIFTVMMFRLINTARATGGYKRCDGDGCHDNGCHGTAVYRRSHSVRRTRWSTLLTNCLLVHSLSSWLQRCSICVYNEDSVKFR